MNAHDWGIQLTTYRSVLLTLAEGDHFYITSYGIRIMSDTGSARAWEAKNIHGTTLQRKNPAWGRDNEGEPYQQRGFAFVTGANLVTAWQKGIKAKIFHPAGDELFYRYQGSRIHRMAATP